MVKRPLSVCVLLVAACGWAGAAAHALTFQGGGRPGSKAWQEAVVAVVARGENMAYGNGFVIGDGTWVATTAHMLIEEAEEGDHRSIALPTVYSRAMGDVGPASIAIMDERNDLAILRVPWPGHPALALATDAQIRAADGAFAGAWDDVWDTDPESDVRLTEQGLYVGIVEPKEGTPRAIVFHRQPGVSQGWSGAPLILDEEDAVIGLVTGSARVKRGKGSEWESCPMARPASIIRLLARRAEQKGGVTAFAQVHPFAAREGSGAAFVHALKASRAKAERKWEEAFAEGEAFLRLRPESPRAHLALASAAAGLDKDDLAEQHYRKALELAPGDWGAHLSYASFLGESDRLDEAVASARKGVELVTDSAEPMALLAQLLDKQGELEEAERIMREAVKREPRHAFLWISLHQVLSHRDNHGGALNAARKAARLHPRRALLQLMLAQALEENDDLDDAEKVYRKALGMEPSNPLACVGLAHFLSDHRPDKLQEALTLVKNAITLNTAEKIPPEALEKLRQELEERLSSEAEPEAG